MSRDRFKTYCKVLGFFTGAVVGGPLGAHVGSVTGLAFGQFLGEHIGEAGSHVLADLTAAHIKEDLSEYGGSNGDFRRALAKALAMSIRHIRPKVNLDNKYCAASKATRKDLDGIFGAWTRTFEDAVKEAGKGDPRALDALFPDWKDSGLLSFTHSQEGVQKAHRIAWESFYNFTLQPIAQNAADLRELPGGATGLRDVILNLLPLHFPAQFAEVVKEPDFEKSWKAYEKLMLTEMLDSVRTLPVEMRGKFAPLERRLDDLETKPSESAQLNDALLQVLSVCQVSLDGILRNTEQVLQTTSAILDSTRHIQRTQEEVIRGLSEIKLGMLSRGSTVRVDPYASVRAPVQNYVERPEVEKRLRELLLSSDHAVALTALQGMGGIGKTELARNLCHDPTIRGAFPDGIVWVDIGRESGKTVLDWMKDVAEKLNDDPAAYTTSNSETRYRTILSGKAVLIVLDNIWSAEDAKRFIPDSPRCRLLFTTRITSIAAEIGASACIANLLSDEQAQAVLAKYAGPERTQLPPEAADIIAECGKLPHGLAEVGAALRGKPRERWADILDKLKHSTFPKVLAPTAVSVDELKKESPSVHDRYLQLAVLLEDMPATEPILRTLWGVDPIAVRDTVDEIENRSLGQRDDGCLRIHDLQMDYVRSVYPHRESLPLIHEALRLSSHVLNQDGAQFGEQMVGRLLLYQDEEGIETFLQKIRTNAPRPWLRPLVSALTPPGTGLFRILQAHGHPISGVAISPDGKVAISGSTEEGLKVWDLDRGRERIFLRDDIDSITSVAISANGKVAVSGYIGRTPLKVWDLDRGHELTTLLDDGVWVKQVAISADGKVAISGYEDGGLKVWDLERGQKATTLKRHSAEISGVAISGDGKVAISGYKDGGLKVWDLERGQKATTLKRHNTEVSGVAISADGKVAISGYKDGGLKVWDLERGQKATTLKRHSAEISGVAISGDGKVAISGYEDGVLKVWDLGRKRERTTLVAARAFVSGVAISANGKVAISGSNDGALKVWDLDRGQKGNTPRRHSADVRDVAISADGKVAVSGSGDGTLTVWDVGRGREQTTLGAHTSYITSVGINADGKVAISGSGDGALKVWDLDRGNELTTLVDKGGFVRCVGINADGKVAISASGGDGTVKVWDLDRKRERTPLVVGPAGFIDTMAISADGKVATVAGGPLTVWDVDRARERIILRDDKDYINCVAISADGKVAISGSYDGTLKVWDLDLRSQRMTLEDHTHDFNCVAISADGKVAISACDVTLKVWDLETAICVATYCCDEEVSCCAMGAGVIAAGDTAGGIYLFALE